MGIRTIRAAAILIPLLLSSGCGGGGGGSDPAAGSTGEAAKEELLDVYTTFMQNAFLLDVYYFSAQGFANPLLGIAPDIRDCYSGGTVAMTPSDLSAITVGSTVEVRYSGCRAANIVTTADGQRVETSSTRDGVAQYSLKSASGDYRTTWSSFALNYDLALADFRTSTSIKIGTSGTLVFGSSMSGTVGYAYTGWNRNTSTGTIAITSAELSLNVSQGSGAPFSPKYRNTNIAWTTTPTNWTRSGHLDLVIGDGALAGKTVSYANLVPAVFDLSVADLTAQAGQAKIKVFVQPSAGLDRFTFGKSLVFARYSPSTVTLEYDLDGDGCLDARGDLTKDEVEAAFLTGGGIARSAIRSLTGPCIPNPTK